MSVPPSKAYPTQPPAGNPVQTLAWGLLQAAKRLDDAVRLPDDREGLLAAARLNWKLWTIIQADILDDESALSLDVRQNLLNLSNFIDKHTVGIITTPSADKLGTLIEINKNIAAGLFDSARNAAAVAEAELQENVTVSSDDTISTSV
jgi:flagellar protein FlaF